MARRVGMSFPSSCEHRRARRQALEGAKRRIAERKGRAVGGDEQAGEPVEVDPQGSVTRTGGRREWFRVARRELEQHRERQARPIPRDRDERLFEAVRRLEENHQIDLAANHAYEHWRATARDTKGRVLRGNSKPYMPPALPDGTINLSDPDSRVMRTQGTPPRQAYNAQTAVNDRQIILAAEVNVDAPDFGHLEPMLDTTLGQLQRHGITELPELQAHRADAGHRRARGRGAGPARRQHARGQTPRLGERALRAHAPQALKRPRPQALRATQDQRRAGLRADQIQPARRPVHAKRQSRRPVGVAAGDSNPQSAQAAQPLDSGHRLRGRNPLTR